MAPEDSAGMPWDGDDIPHPCDREEPPELLLVSSDQQGLSGARHDRWDDQERMLGIAKTGQPRRLPEWGGTLPEPARYLFEDLVPEGSCIVLGAEQKTGKTWFTLALAIALAKVRPVLRRWRATRKGTTLLYSPEGATGANPSQDAFHRRLWRMIWGEGVGRDEDPLDVGDLPELIRRYPGRLDLLDDESYADLAATVQSLRPDLLFLDPLISCYRSCDENSSADMQPALDRIRDLLLLNPRMSIIVVHHYNKGGSDQKNPWSGLRGSNALAAWADGLVALTNPSASPGGPRRVEVWLRDGKSTDPAGFVLVDGPMVVNGLEAIQLAPCGAPERKGARASKQKEERKTRVLKEISARPGKWTAKALAQELLGEMEAKESAIRGYCTELKVEGKIVARKAEGSSQETLWPA